MASQQPQVSANGDSSPTDFVVKAGLAQMLKGGVIMDVVNAEQVCTKIQLCYFFIYKRRNKMAGSLTYLNVGSHC